MWRTVLCASIVVSSVALAPAAPASADTRPAKAKRASQGKRSPLVAVRNGGRAGAIDLEGRVVIPFEYDLLGAVDGELIPVEVGGRWGFVDRRGREVVAPRFDWLEAHHEGRALVRIGDRFGYLDERGELVIPAEYAGASGFANGVARVRLADGAERFIDRRGRLQPEGFVPPWRPARAATASRRPLVRFEQHGRIGFRDDAGNPVVPARYTRADTFDIDWPYVRVWDDAGRCGYLDAAGVEVVAPAYDECRTTLGGPTGVARGGQWGYVDVATGNVVVPLRYEAIGWFSRHGYGPVKRDGRWGAVDAKGRVVIQPRFDGEPAFDGTVWRIHEERGGAVQIHYVNRDDRLVWTELHPAGWTTSDCARSLSAAWTRYGADTDARARALPWLRELGEALLYGGTRFVRVCVEAELALASDQPPSPARRVAEMIAAHVPPVLDPEEDTTFSLHPLLRDPVGERLRVEWELRAAGGTSILRAGTVALAPAVIDVPVEVTGIADGDYVVALRVVDGDEVLRTWEQPTSIVAGFRARSGPRRSTPRRGPFAPPRSSARPSRIVPGCSRDPPRCWSCAGCRRTARSWSSRRRSPGGPPATPGGARRPATTRSRPGTAARACRCGCTSRRSARRARRW